MKVSYPASPWDPSSVGFILPPRHSYVVPDENERRLIPTLRNAAKTRDPITILARAAARFYEAQQATTLSVTQAQAALGAALADLAVTGRESYRALRDLSFKVELESSDLTSLETSLEVATRNELAEVAMPPADADIRVAISKALDRAYEVAWALRGPVIQRVALRERLGWIAVSGEDDKPHRPVNVPAPPYEQHEIEVPVDVSVPGFALPKVLRLWTRFFVASADGELAPAQPGYPREPPDDPRKLPDNIPSPTIPLDHDVILFLHGHSSGAEEALELIPHLIQAGLERGKKYSVISFDLPNNGYSDTFVNTEVAAEDETTYPHRPDQSGPIRTPILDFIDDFVVSFVNELDQMIFAPKGTPIKNRIAVIGGSLGGNLALRLGRRDSATSSWIAKAIAAWSAASVWMPMVQHVFRSEGPQHCLVEFKKLETDDARADYFHQVYDNVPLPLVIKQQPEYWYRAGWNAKDFQILLSRIARREIYNANYRQWHWRVAGEQLIYSHFDNLDHGDVTQPKHYELNTVRTLLIAGEADNYPYVGIYDGTKTLGYAMPTEGRLLLVKDAGHSIHFEHPRYLAYEIVKFLNARSMQITHVSRENGRIERVAGTDQTDATSFNISRQECINFIERGDEFYVTGSDGEQVMVSVVGSGTFLRSMADGVEGNNLDSLPEP